MKRILLLLLVTCLTISACGSQSKQATSATEPELSDTPKNKDIIIENNIDSKEDKEQTSESNSAILKEKKYDIANDDFINLSIYDDGSLNALIYIDDTEKMALAFAYFQTNFSKLNGINVSVGGFCENGSIIWTKTESGEMINSSDNSGNVVSTFPDWASNTLDNPTMTEDEQTEFIELLNSYSSDFISENNNN